MVNYLGCDVSINNKQLIIAYFHKPLSLIEVNNKLYLDIIRFNRRDGNDKDYLNVIHYQQ
jgi:hypothetical protein